MATNSFMPIGAILFVADSFHPVNGFAVELSRMARCVMAVVGDAPCRCFSSGNGDDGAGPDFFNRPAPVLRASAGGGLGQCLIRKNFAGADMSTLVKHVP